MSDLIDRQAAISAICNACGKIDCDKMDKCEKLPLPPANNSEIPNSSDTISRQAALVAVKDALMAWSYMPEWRDEKILEAIAELPPAQPKRIRGRWTRDNACSECGCQPWFSGDIHNYNFCPNCGADMREVTA